MMTTGMDDFVFAASRPRKRGSSGFMGGLGGWMLHLAALAFAIYSGYHGISASHNYAGNDTLARAAQTFGIVVLEIVLMAIYISWYNGKIVGSEQHIVAGVTYAIGFVMALLTIITDSRLHANGELGALLRSYLGYGLPLAPAVMALGAVLIHMLSPAKQRERREADEDDEYQREVFDADMAYRRGQLEARRQAAALKIASTVQAARLVAESYKTPPIQAAILSYARQAVPALLREVGISVDDLPELPDAPIEETHSAVPIRSNQIIRPNQIGPSVAPAAPPSPTPLSAEQLLRALGGQARVARELALEGSAESLWRFYRENGILPDGTARQIFDAMCAPLVAPATPGGNANGEATFRQ